jgi:DNA-binding beta-propeller fold protein YncE
VVVGRTLVSALVALSILGTPGAVAGGILGPTTIAAGFGSVWIGMGSGEVVRLDARTGHETARLKGSPTGFVHGVSVAHGALWVLRGRVLRVDPRTRGTREVRGVGGATLFALAVSAGGVWVADDGANTVTRIDPKRMSRSAVVHVPGRAFGLAAGGDQVFVVSVPTSGPVTGPDGRRLLRRIDPATNRLSKPLAELDCDPGIAVGRAAVWTLDPCADRLVRRDPETLRPNARIAVPQAQTLVLGFGSVWLVCGDRVLRIDRETLRVTATIPVRGATAAVGRHAVWILSLGDGIRGNVTKIDPRTNRVVGRSIPIVPKP